MIIETKLEFDNFLEKYQDSSCILIPVLCDVNKHPLENSLCLLYVKLLALNDGGEYGHPRHRALHDILNHLRPEILWQYDKSKERLPALVLRNKRDLLKVYKSQREVLDWFSPWYEVITKVNK